MTDISPPCRKPGAWAIGVCCMKNLGMVLGVVILGVVLAVLGTPG